MSDLNSSIIGIGPPPNPNPPPDPRWQICDQVLRGQGESGGPYPPGCDLPNSAAVIEGVNPRPSKAGSEFPNQDVIYVNGINTSEETQRKDLQAIADMTHSSVTGIHLAKNGTPAQDLAEVAAAEKVGPTYSPVENAVHDRIKSDLDSGGKVHVLSHSAGALITQRSLERIQGEYQKAGMSDTDIAKRFSNVEFESFGGAAGSVPNGVKAVAYVDKLDPVANEVGAGSPNKLLDAGLAATGLPPGLISAVDGARIAGGLSRPFDGRVVTIPATADGTHPLGDQDAILYTEQKPGTSLLTNHAVGWYLENRENFEKAYAPIQNQHEAEQRLIDSVNPRIPAPSKIPVPGAIPNPQP